MVSHAWKFRLLIARRSKLRKIDPDVIRTRNLLIWSQTRYRCARSHLARMEDSDMADHATQHQAELENIAQNIE